MKLPIAVVMSLMILCSNSPLIAQEGEPKMHIVKKDKLEFELQLYNGENLPSLIPSISKQAKEVKYIFGCVKNLSGRAAYLTFIVKSPNNPSLSSNKVILNTVGEKAYFLLWAMSPDMSTTEEKVIFDVEITDVMFKG